VGSTPASRTISDLTAAAESAKRSLTMTLKPWVLWLCIAVLVISELLLFSARQQKNAAQADARNARQQINQLQAELEQSTNSSSEAQSAEIARLRSENQDLLRLRNQVRQLTETNQQLAQQLKSVHLVVQQQQDELQAWQADAVAAQQAQRAAALAAQEQAQTEATQRNGCINNLRQIDAAKQQWALVNNKTDEAIPTAADLLPYLKGGVFPVCPNGGTYTVSAVGLPPTCSIPGHVLPPP
jgi:DNA repair exonuclease SbcCD ATPase subunit